MTCLLFRSVPFNSQIFGDFPQNSVNFQLNSLEVRAYTLHGFHSFKLEIYLWVRQSLAQWLFHPRWEGTCAPPLWAECATTVSLATGREGSASELVPSATERAVLKSSATVAHCLLLRSAASHFPSYALEFHYQLCQYTFEIVMFYEQTDPFLLYISLSLVIFLILSILSDINVVTLRGIFFLFFSCSLSTFLQLSEFLQLT